MTSDSGAAGAFERVHPGEGMRALEKERALPLTGWQQEVDQAHRWGLEAAESIVDRRISTFSRGELPHFAGINTFMKAGRSHSCVCRPCPGALGESGFCFRMDD